MKKFLLFITILLLILIGNGCSTSKNAFEKKKYHSISKKDYKSKKGLMLLENTQLGRNKYYYSKSNQKRKKLRIK